MSEASPEVASTEPASPLAPSSSPSLHLTPAIVLNEKLKFPSEIWLRIYEELVPPQVIVINDESRTDQWDFIRSQDGKTSAWPTGVSYPEGSVYLRKFESRWFRATTSHCPTIIARARVLNKVSQTALKDYQRYGWWSLENDNGPTAEKGVWFNGRQDILFFNQMTAIEALLEISQFMFPFHNSGFDLMVRQNKCVKIIAVRLTDHDMNERFSSLSNQIKLLAVFTSLETLYIEYKPITPVCIKIHEQFPDLNEDQVYNLAKKPFVDHVRNLLAIAMQESGHQFPMPEIIARESPFFLVLPSGYPVLGIHSPGAGLSETSSEALERSPTDDNPFRAMRRALLEEAIKGYEALERKLEQADIDHKDQAQINLALTHEVIRLKEKNNDLNEQIESFRAQQERWMRRETEWLRGEAQDLEHELRRDRGRRTKNMTT